MKNVFLRSAIDDLGRAHRIAAMGIYLAFGIILNVISNFFSSASAGFFGTVTIMYVYTFLGGILFGALRGGLISGLADLIQAAMTGGIIWWQLVASNVMLSVITGLVVYGLAKLIRPFVARLVISSVLCLIFCSAGLTAWAYTAYTGLKAAKNLVSGWGLELSPFMTCVIWRLCTQWLWILLNDIVLVALLRGLKKPLTKMKLDMSAVFVQKSKPAKASAPATAN